MDSPTEEVADFYASLRRLAQAQLPGLESTVRERFGDASTPADEPEAVVEEVSRGDAVLIDTRPRGEFEAGHVAQARSIPIDELEERLGDRFGRKAVLIGGWLIALPVPFLLMWAPTWGWIIFAIFFLAAGMSLEQIGWLAAIYPAWTSSPPGTSWSPCATKAADALSRLRPIFAQRVSVRPARYVAGPWRGSSLLSTTTSLST